jgi:hypothetical protein
VEVSKQALPNEAIFYFFRILDFFLGFNSLASEGTMTFTECSCYVSNCDLI